MDLLVFVFVIVASLIAKNSGSPVPSKFQDAEYIDDEILDDIIPGNLSRNAFKYPAYLWPGGKVPFKIDKQFDKKRVGYIRRAMREISKVSCVEFVDAPKSATTFLFIRASQNGCRATLGYGKDTNRDLYLDLDELDTGCFRIGTIIHELMHVLGFVHQHTVPDRDKYVKILYENIKEDAVSKFKKWNNIHITDLGLPYDFGSLMHNSLNSYSRNGKMTIRPIVDVGNVVIGQRKGLSKLDIEKLNKLYKCCA